MLVDDEEAFQKARAYMQAFMPRGKTRLTCYSDRLPLFTRYGLESQIDRIYERRVELPSGGSIVIDGTEALTAIDVNSGRSTRAATQEETALHTNLEAANEVARQLRLRDIGGLVVVDFIDMRASKNQRKLEKVLKDALKADKARANVGRISPNGLLEINRQRIQQALQVRTHRSCPTCNGSGRLASEEMVSLSLLRRIEARAASGSIQGVRDRAPPGARGRLPERPPQGAGRARGGVRHRDRDHRGAGPPPSGRADRVVPAREAAPAAEAETRRRHPPALGPGLAGSSTTKRRKTSSRSRSGPPSARRSGVGSGGRSAGSGSPRRSAGVAGDRTGRRRSPPPRSLFPPLPPPESAAGPNETPEEAEARRRKRRRGGRKRKKGSAGAHDGAHGPEGDSLFVQGSSEPLAAREADDDHEPYEAADGSDTGDAGDSHDSHEGGEGNGGKKKRRRRRRGGRSRERGATGESLDAADAAPEASPERFEAPPPPPPVPIPEG